MNDYLPGMVLLGGIAAVWFLRIVLSREDQQDRRWILLVIGAVGVSAVAGIVAGTLLR